MQSMRKKRQKVIKSMKKMQKKNQKKTVKRVYTSKPGSQRGQNKTKHPRSTKKHLCTSMNVSMYVCYVFLLVADWSKIRNVAR